MMLPYDLPFSARKRAAGALGCRRVSLSRRAGSQLHQATGRAARRNDPDLSRRRVREECRQRQISAGPQADSTSERRLRSPCYDDRHRPRRLRGKTEWQRWRSEAHAAGRPSIPAASRYECDGELARRVGRVALSDILCPIPSNGRPFRKAEPCRGRRASTLITDFYSYNTNMTAEFYNLVDDVQQAPDGAWMQPHWVGDLTLQTEP